MMMKFPLIAVDWGTTHMRAMLCEAGDGPAGLTSTTSGAGISKLEQSPADELFDVIGPWVAQHGKLDLLLGGMVGSNIGWREAPYLPCPMGLDDLARNLMRFEERGHRVAIVPGVSCTNRLGQPDVMRGEETQVLGWLRGHAKSRSGDRLLCLPGTHTKWVQLVDGQLKSFTTSMTGELYSILREHSVLVSKADLANPASFDTAAFRSGVELARDHSNDFLHALFSTRSRALIGSGSGDSSSFLSGLIIGVDVISALKNFPAPATVIELIGALPLCEKFALAAEVLGHASRTSDGVDLVFDGFRAIARGDFE